MGNYVEGGGMTNTPPPAVPPKGLSALSSLYAASTLTIHSQHTTIHGDETANNENNETTARRQRHGTNGDDAARAAPTALQQQIHEHASPVYLSISTL